LTDRFAAYLPFEADRGAAAADSVLPVDYRQQLTGKQSPNAGAHRSLQEHIAVLQTAGWVEQPKLKSSRSQRISTASAREDAW